MVRGIPGSHQVVLMDEVPYLIYCETRSYLDISEHRARAGRNPFWNDPPPAAKAERKSQVDEVQILLKAYDENRF
jgi:hypothetical protein